MPNLQFRISRRGDRQEGWLVSDPSNVDPGFRFKSTGLPQGCHRVATMFKKKKKIAVLGAPSAVSEGMLVPMGALLVYLRTLVQCVWAAIFHDHSLF